MGEFVESIVPINTEEKMNDFVESTYQLNREDIKAYELAKVSELIENFKKLGVNYDTTILFDFQLYDKVNKEKIINLKDKIKETTHILLSIKEGAIAYPRGLLIKLKNEFKNHFDNDDENIHKKLNELIISYITTTKLSSFFTTTAQIQNIYKYYLLNLTNFNLSGGNKKTKGSDKYTVKQLKTMAFVYNVKTTKKSNGKIVNLKSDELLAKLKKSKIIL